jgi:hypothetical protein
LLAQAAEVALGADDEARVADDLARADELRVAISR